MLHIVLYQPEIPPNTGNAIRLCANAGAHLHLVEPLGFEISDRTLARAGMDYAELSVVTIHPDWESCKAALAGRRFFCATTRGVTRHDQCGFQPGDVVVFGGESSGLPEAVREEFEPAMRIRLPMRPGNRSINLSNSVAIVVYEAWRQQGFGGVA
ncbi:tRNA (cytidine(34)-2'-O)-methyltransferase [Uliginosibacterium sp. H1]|uniref:tRNA (cytidine(34)-2'-O)-methyltransferase n=1 Tax=Uliginosibacterium sp. H1 TaxID=3114757 RepID=UPI002E1913D4|nr:tRNA (cytidine(34)-2'-O)-methyltransferase [Uliginosibacterium sp. H1]